MLGPLDRARRRGVSLLALTLLPAVVATVVIVAVILGTRATIPITVALDTRADILPLIGVVNVTKLRLPLLNRFKTRCIRQSYDKTAAPERHSKSCSGPNCLSRHAPVEDAKYTPHSRRGATNLHLAHGIVDSTAPIHLTCRPGVGGRGKGEGDALYSFFRR